MELLKKIFNWIKLFLALDCLGVSIAALIAGRAEFQKGPDKWGPLLLAFGVFFIAGLLLLFWFYKSFQKLRKNKKQQLFTGPESDFYQNYPRLARFFDGWSFNGFGSRYLTYSNKQSDGSINATKWITFAFFPVVPLYQEKIKIISEREKIHIPFFVSSNSLKYTVVERIAISRKLVLLTRLFYFVFILTAIVLPVILFLVFLPELNEHLQGPQLWWVILGYFVWGIFLIYLTELFNKKWFL